MNFQHNYTHFVILFICAFCLNEWEKQINCFGSILDLFNVTVTSLQNLISFSSNGWTLEHVKSIKNIILVIKGSCAIHRTQKTAVLCSQCGNERFVLLKTSLRTIPFSASSIVCNKWNRCRKYSGSVQRRRRDSIGEIIATTVLSRCQKGSSHDM